MLMPLPTVAKPSKVTKAEAEAMSQVREMTLVSLLDGGHPFIQPAAEFSVPAERQTPSEF